MTNYLDKWGYDHPPGKKEDEDWAVFILILAAALFLWWVA